MFPYFLPVNQSKTLRPKWTNKVKRFTFCAKHREPHGLRCGQASPWNCYETKECRKDEKDSTQGTRNCEHNGLQCNHFELTYLTSVEYKLRSGSGLWTKSCTIADICLFWNLLGGNNWCTVLNRLFLNLRPPGPQPAWLNRKGTSKDERKTPTQTSPLKSTGSKGGPVGSRWQAGNDPLKKEDNAAIPKATTWSQPSKPRAHVFEPNGLCKSGRTITCPTWVRCNVVWVLR